MSIQAGEVLAGKYRIERVLGEGGMGVVVVATHIELDDRVAIKFLHPEVARSAEIVTRFLREGRASRKIQSEHVVRVADVGTFENGAPYMVMEYLDGCDLAQLVERNGPLPIADAIDYLLQACEAIAEAHALGIVHRDLKPANLFLTKRRDGSSCVKVLDFGISKAGTDTASAALTKTTGVMGSPLYMSPEQLQSARDVDARTDIWALGIVLYELLAGAQPFYADTLPQLTVAIVLQEPAPLRAVRPDAPPELQAVIEQCLRKNREERVRTVGALAAALAPFAPASAQLSIDRILRVTGTVAPELARQPAATVPAIHGASPLLSTTTGTSVEPSAAATLAQRKKSPLPWIAGAAGVVLVGAAVAFLSFGRDETPKEKTRPARDKATSEESEPTAAKQKASAEAAPPSASTPSSPSAPLAAASSTTSPNKPSAPADPGAGVAGRTKKPAPSATQKPPPKNNNDDPTL